MCRPGNSASQFVPRPRRCDKMSRLISSRIVQLLNFSTLTFPDLELDLHL